MTMPAMPAHVEAVFAGFPAPAAQTLSDIRALIFEEANRLGVGPLEETLKWGEPAYLTTATKAGSTIRLGWKEKTPAQCHIYVNCQTTIADQIRSHFPGVFKISGNRCISFDVDEAVPEAPLRIALSLALNYHKNKASA